MRNVSATPNSAAGSISAGNVRVPVGESRLSPVDNDNGGGKGGSWSSGQHGFPLYQGVSVRGAASAVGTVGEVPRSTRGGSSVGSSSPGPGSGTSRVKALGGKGKKGSRSLVAMDEQTKFKLEAFRRES